MDVSTLSAEDLACPICMERLKDPFVTPCGHSFCYTCIATHLHHRNVCPCCSVYMTVDSVFPNFLLSKVVVAAAKAEMRRKGTMLQQLQEVLSLDGHGLKLADLDAVLQTLERKRHDMQLRERETSLELLMSFLTHSREAKAKKLQELENELQILEKDIRQVETRNAALLPGFPMLPAAGGMAISRALSAGERPAAAPHGRGFNQPVPPGAQANALHACTEAAAGGAHGSQAGATPVGRHDSQQLVASSLFHANGRHISSGALALDTLGQPIPQRQLLRPASTYEPRASGQSERLSAQVSSGPSLLPANAVGGAASDSAQVSLSSDARQPSGSAELPLTPGGTGREEPGAAGVPGDTQPAASQSWQRASSASFREPHAHAGPQLAFYQASPGTASAAPPQGRHSSEPSTEAPSHGTLDSSLAPSTSGDGLDRIPRARKRRFEAQFEDLQQHYLRMRQRQMHGAQPGREGETAAASGAAAAPAAASDRSAPHALRTQPSSAARDGSSGAAIGPIETDDLREFSRMLALFTRSSRLKVLAAIPGASQRASSAIISSIAFDCEARTFATAGVSKRISVFDYEGLVGAQANSAEGTPAPLLELVSRSKLSCLSWNRFLPARLASSDYEGVATLWDVAAGQPVAEVEAHDKRIWSVDCCPSDPARFATGSDDGFVKIGIKPPFMHSVDHPLPQVWSTAQSSRAVVEIDMRANVCCVQHSPTRAHELAVASADHQVHVYDLRQPSRALHAFLGHRKAVSYVRYLSESEVVSASTDGTLKAWHAASAAPLRTYSGHLNEKNFVGLSLSGSFIASGSETSEVFVYYRQMSTPVARAAFQPAPATSSGSSSLGAPRPNLQFVSALAWKPDSQVLLAANSQGAIQAMQLTA